LCHILYIHNLLKQHLLGKGSSEAEWAKKHLLGKGVAKITPDGGKGSSEAGWALIQPDTIVNL
jgi:hypothetical protein